MHPLTGTGLPDDSGLPDSWTRVDERTREFALREGMTFYDGTDFTSKDVVYAIRQMKSDSAAPAAPSSIAAPPRLRGWGLIG